MTETVIFSRRIDGVEHGMWWIAQRVSWPLHRLSAV